MAFQFAPTMFQSSPLSAPQTPVMALHGTASSSRQWRSLTDYIGNRFEVHTPDLPGYGRNAIGRSNDQSLEATAREIGAQLDALNQPAHLIGHSFGAAVALKIATLWPEKIRSLTLIEPAAFSPFWTEYGITAHPTRAFVEMGGIARAQALRGQTHHAMRSFIDFWNGSGAWHRTSAGLRDKLAPGITQVLNDFDALLTDTMTEHDLAGVICPVHILRGDASPRVMATLTRHLRNRLPFASETVIPEAGHMVPMTDPHLVDPAILKFLTKVDQVWRSCKTPLARAA